MGIKNWKRIAVAACAVMCLSNNVFVFAQQVSADSDNDGVENILDNCAQIANVDQVDADKDGYGNACDADLNNDLIVNFVDYLQFVQSFLSDDAVADFNSDGIVNFLDLSIFVEQFLQRPGPSGVVAAQITLEPTRLYADLNLGSILHMKLAPSSSDRWVAIQRQGVVVSFMVDGSSDALSTVVDISSQVDTTFEGGLLGLAFDPNFLINGYMYLSYTTTGAAIGGPPMISRVSRFTTSTDAQGYLIADPESEVILITADQPFTNHNGGDIEFGPDGYLYWSLGDGGAGGDPMNNAQITSNLLGTIVRISTDVTEADIAAGVTYKIPPTNPFSTNIDCEVACPEIYAWGLRNPFRFSFDSVTGLLWAGDVGQSAREEISIVENGGNYGWRCYEGDLQFDVSKCDIADDFVDPVYVYAHSLGTSVTGGVVYRGNAMADLHGMYIFGDYGSGRFWGLYGGDYADQLFATGHSPVAFTEDGDGEVYYISLGFVGGSQVYKIGQAAN